MQKSTIYLWLVVSTIVLFGIVTVLVPDMALEASLIVGVGMLLTIVTPIYLINASISGLKREGEDTLTELQGAKRRLTVLEAKLEEATSLDELTGCMNRRRFVEVLTHHRAMSIRSDYEFTIAVTQIDQFGDIVEKHGLDGGNEVLQIYSRIIKSALRDTDSVARLEADRFGLFLSACDEENALRIIDRISSLISQVQVSEDSDIKITASGGITCFHGEEDAEEMMDHAVQALEFATKQGFGSVVGYKFKAPDKPETSEETSTSEPD